MTSSNFDISVSESAEKRILSLIDDNKRENIFFRIKISGGGCAGFQYSFDFDDKAHDDDIIIETSSVKIIIDEVSIELVKGSEVHYVEDLIGSYFQLRNPNAQSTCGCGTSFSV